MRVNFVHWSATFFRFENVLLQSRLCHTHKFQQQIQMIKLNSDFSCTIYSGLHNFHYEWDWGDIERIEWKTK